MRFAKYHGLGNDFLIVDLRGGDREPASDRVVELCDRHTGVGGDGVLAVLPPVTEGAHARMRVLNADGSEAEMCGNGIRCVVKYLHDRDPALRLARMVIDTGGGPLACDVSRVGQLADTIAVDMGRPRLNRGEIPMTGPAGERCVGEPLEVGGRTFAFTVVSMGNPHAVTFVDESGPALRALAESIGPTVERHAWFPRRTNVEFARVHSAEHIELVVWERGCGITLACGTGACATAVAACLAGSCQPGREIRVTLLGGDLAITVLPDYSAVLMRGPARHVFDGDTLS